MNPHYWLGDPWYAPEVSCFNVAAALAVPPGRRGRGELPVSHTVYVLTGEGEDAKLQAVQIRTGISDGISTEVLSGLDEGAQVVTGMLSPGTQAATSANPFGGGGGFPRMR